MTNRLTDDDQLRLLSAASIVNTKVYQLQLITPMAVHGYKGSKAAEFRISSLRGVLRYWWRTLQFNKEKEELLSDEVQIFGGIKPKAVASPVKFYTKNKLYCDKIRREEIMPGNNRKKGKFSVLDEQKIESIQLKMMVKADHDLNQYDKYFEYMMLLGSIGQRSRRGFGAFQFADTYFATISDFKNYLIQLLEALGVRLITPNDTAILRTKMENICDHPCLSSVYICKRCPTAVETLKLYEEAAHQAALNYHDSLGSIEDKKTGKKKLSSPLWGTVKRIGDGYYPVVTELMSRAVRKRPNYNSGKKKFLEVLGVKE